MRCMTCDAEMNLMNVVADHTMAVPGFEHHTFMCPQCHDVERRLVFIRRGRESDPALVPAHIAPPIAGEQSGADPVLLVDAAPSISPNSVAVLEEPSVSLLGRVIARLRGR